MNEENKRHLYLNALSPHPQPTSMYNDDHDKASTSKPAYTCEEARHRGKIRAQGKRADTNDAKFFLVEHLSLHRRPARMNGGFRDGLPGVMDAASAEIDELRDIQDVLESRIVTLESENLDLRQDLDEKYKVALQMARVQLAMEKAVDLNQTLQSRLESLEEENQNLKHVLEEKDWAVLELERRLARFEHEAGE